MPNKPLAYYLDAFTSLQQDRASVKKYGFGAPHKPILVISLIQAFYKGIITDRTVYLSPQLVSLFTSNWTYFVPGEGYQPFIAQPFYHLTNEHRNWWHLLPNPGCETWLENAGSMKSFRNLTSAVAYAEIDDDLVKFLSDSQNRDLLFYAVVDKYFPHRSGTHVSQLADSFEQLSRDIIEKSPEEYRADVERERAEAAADPKYKDLFEQKVFARSGAFQKGIPYYYGQTCCISGIQISATFSMSMIDACHIIDFAKSYNDTITNGIALCPNLHRAFDRGMISVDDDFKVIVSKRFTENPSAKYLFGELAGTSLLLPLEPKFHPLAENFAWHRRHRFKQ
ncbi:HNH endonuclease [Spirosoma pomorum]